MAAIVKALGNSPQGEDTPMVMAHHTETAHCQ